MAQPRFSIVIPTYNREDLVGYTIQSALRQTFADFEVIVCDNCSTDRTADVVRQYHDSRVTYIRTPRHMVIADNWEFARSHATGDLIVMLGDDDALLPTTLQRIDAAATRHDADFLFCATVEYRDRGFPGADRNTLDSRPFTGSTRRVGVEEFVKSLFSFNHIWMMHPSSFFFSRALGDAIAERCGRFFQTNGVEYCAWPMAAVFAKGIALVDLPLSICGRTKKSWGSNLFLANPGKERVQKFIDDVDHNRKHAPLTNFTMTNLMAEGILTAKYLFPHEFRGYVFDEQRYMALTLVELRARQALGVDVSREMQDLVSHLDKYPHILKDAQAAKPTDTPNRKPWWLRIRGWIGDLGLRELRDRRATRLRVSGGDIKTGFRISGRDFGFSNIVECADVLERLIGTSADEAGKQDGLVAAAPSFSR